MLHPLISIETLEGLEVMHLEFCSQLCCCVYVCAYVCVCVYVYIYILIFFTRIQIYTLI